MQLDQISVSVRPRSNWEAVDLGFRMVQQWWRAIYPAWILLFFPFCLILGLLFHDQLAIAMLIVWWSKPLFDRIPLHVVSRAVFGDIPDRQETVRAFFKMGFSFPFSQLTIYRFSPARSLLLPVWQLEGLRGRSRLKRAQVLGKQAYSSAFALTLIGVHFEIIIIFSCILLGAILAPQYFSDFFEMFQGWLEFVKQFFVSDGPYMKVLYIIYCATISFLEPFYVAAGFSLYINRRTILEAWDLELIFRRLAQRVKKFSQFSVVIISVLIGCSLFVPQANAEEFHSPVIGQSQKEKSKEVIKNLMKQEKFNQYKTIKYRQLFENDDEKDDPNINFGENFFSVGIGNLFQIVLWGIAILALVYIIYFLIKNPPNLDLSGDKKHKPSEILGMDITEESMPDDIGEEALSLIEAGKLREALSLLYRGTLGYVVKNDLLELKDSYTEHDCLAEFKNNLSNEMVEYFDNLNQMWIKAAYAHLEPDTFSLQQLCIAWPKHFTQHD